MKVLALVLIVAVLAVVLFVLGVFSPTRSRRLQRNVDQKAKKAEGKADRNGGRMGDMTRDALKHSRRVVDRSAEKGREVHDRVTRDGGSRS